MTTKLTEEIATPETSGVRPSIFTPIGDLTPTRLEDILANVDMGGDATEYLTLAEEMEEKDLHYHSVLSTRKLAVVGLDIIVSSVTDDPKDIEQTEFVKEIFASDFMGDLVMDLADALGKGYSVCEIIWQRGKTFEPVGFKHRDPRYFQFDRATQSILALKDDSDYVNGIQLEKNRFIIHRPKIKSGLAIRGGLARLASLAYMCKGYALKDWMAFAEVFGIPLRLGKYPAGADKSQRDALMRAVASMGTDAACIVPETMQIEFQSGADGAGGDVLFKALADWLDSQVSKAVLGQTMTTDNGSSLAQANVHNDVREDIQKSDAKQMAATLREYLVKPLIDINFGERPSRKYPQVSLSSEEVEDLEALSRSLPPFIDRGLPIEVSSVLDKFGLSVPEPGAPILKAPTPAPAFGPTAPANAPPGADIAEEPEDVEGAPNAGPTDEEMVSKTRQLIVNTITRGIVGQFCEAIASASGNTTDDIDRLVDDAMGGWDKVMDPILAPIIALASESMSDDEFLRRLNEGSKISGNKELIKQIATMTFQARGIGDVRDQP